ncbi:MAG: hypothetical protein PHQ32_07405 [Firmicutes bacterium]|nr:hypothetical protein [Bacillota bacterium]
MRKNIGYVKKTRLKTKTGRKRRINGNLPKALWFIYPVIYIFFIQSLSFASLIKGFINTLVNPYYFVLTYLLVVGFSFVLWLFFENRWISFSVLNGLGLILALGNRFTIPKGETGLAINNIGIFKELGLIQSASLISFTPFIIMILFFLPILYLLIYFMYQWKQGLKYRQIAAIGSLLIFLFISQLIIPLISSSKNSLSNVDKLGVILFFNNGVFSKNNIKYPDEISVKEIIEKVDLKTNEPITKPNIIMVQLTNFVDISRIESLDTDPLNNYHNTFNEASTYSVDLSAKDNNNLNIEFEVLAGLPVEFHPNELQVRAGNTSLGTISLGSILSEQGYASESILPYSSDDRAEFYEKLGFDDYIGSEDLGDGAIKDILAEIKVKLDKSVDTNKPVFIYTHFNLLQSNYEDVDTDQYINDLKLLDAQIADLKKTILESKEPTILMFYSDELPTLGIDNKIYYDSGYLKSTDSKLEIEKKLNTGDILLWDNYNEGASYQNGDTFDLCSIPFLLLNKCGLSMPNYLQYFQYLKDEEGLSRISSDYLEINKVIFANNTNEYRNISKEFSIVIKDVLGPYKYIERN